MWTEEKLILMYIMYDIHEYKNLTKDNNVTPKKDQVYTVTFLPSTAHWEAKKELKLPLKSSL